MTAAGPASSGFGPGAPGHRPCLTGVNRWLTCIKLRCLCLLWVSEVSTAYTGIHNGMQVNQRLTPVKPWRWRGSPEPKPEQAPPPSWPRAPARC